MRIAYLDTFAGISGDMLLGAFVHAGVPIELLRHALKSLDLGATLQVEEVHRSGIHALKVHILVDGQAPDSPPADHTHHGHPHPHNAEAHHPHDHSHSHSHIEEARSLTSIRALIGKTELPEAVKTLAFRTFQLLGESEAKIHHVPLESIHFHEVGAVDAIADIVLAATAAHALKIDVWHCSPLNVGGGTVECAHGRFPVPAPATAELLRGAPTYSSGIQLELVTPTGAALVRALNCTFGPMPALSVTSIGYGAGTRNPPGFANVVRLSIGESAERNFKSETVWVLEAAVDDLNPQIMAYVTEQALQRGALDVMSTPVAMKKNRSGTLLTILSDQDHLEALKELVLQETSTLGLRIHKESRICLERRHVEVSTEWGSVRVKIGHQGERIYNAAPEFEDGRRLAEKNGVPVKLVLEAALQAYRKSHS